MPGWGWGARGMWAAYSLLFELPSFACWKTCGSQLPPLSTFSLCLSSVGGAPASFLFLCLGAALAFAFLLLLVGLVLSGRECDYLSPLSVQRWSRAPCLQARPVFLILGVWDCQVSTLSIFVPVVILFITECFLFLPRFLVTPGNLER